MTKTVQTDVLVVGAGPAGASTAAFLGRFEVGTLMISRHRGTAHTPRAHIVNQRTMEVLRDAGLEQECLAIASPGTLLAHTFWLRSMAGEELARAWAWGNDPARSSDYATASPCRIIDLPQTQMEPILVKEATRLGANVRFGWELQSFTQDEDGVSALIRDRLSETDIAVRTKYMVGADGARSRTVDQLGLPLTGRHGLGLIFNVLCEVDLSAHVAHRHGSLYNVIQPGSSSWGPVAVYRMVRPWDRWLVGLIVPPDAAAVEPTPDEFSARIAETVGDDSLAIRILDVSKWYVNDVYAETYSVGRVYCMGDAVHRHPPANALGSNTCIQDGFNLAWKLALVLKGKAHPRLLASFNDERQPVGKQIVERANKSLMHNFRMMDLLGAGTRTQLAEEELAQMFTTPEGRKRVREELGQAAYNGLAHGVEMSRRYRSAAVVSDGTPEPASARDPELFYDPSTWPGSPIPHAWLVRRHPSPLVSTLDVAGNGVFHLFTGHGGEDWRNAAEKTSRGLGVEVRVTSIGAFLDYEDPYGDWCKVRGVDDDGCVLVRPDLIVGWRCSSLPADPAQALDGAMKQILGWTDV